MGTNEAVEFVNQACKETASQVRYALAYEAELAVRVFAEHSEWPDMQPMPRRPQAARCPPLQLVPNEGQGHQPQQTASGWKCARCGKRARRWHDLADTRCGGHAAAQLTIQFGAQAVTDQGHVLWKTGPWVWCRRCGHHAQQRLAGLRTRCPGHPEQTWQLGNLCAGRAPKAKVRDRPVGTPTPLTLSDWDNWWRH